MGIMMFLLLGLIVNSDFMFCEFENLSKSLWILSLMVLSIGFCLFVLLVYF